MVSSVSNIQVYIRFIYIINRIGFCGIMFLMIYGFGGTVMEFNFSIDEFKNLSLFNSKRKNQKIINFLVFDFSYFVVNDLWTLLW